MLPQVSIIIPCYNYGLYINEAIISVEQCTDASLYEIIIINDGSTDPFTIDVLKNLEAKGYRVINQENQGLGAARNNGIRIAKGKYILPLDADNKIRPEYLKEGMKVMENHPEIGVVYGNALKFGEDDGVWKSRAFDPLALFGYNYIDACAIYRKSVWESVGGYFTDMPVMGLEDWMFWIQALTKEWKFEYIDKVLYDYRVRNGSMITSLQNDKNKSSLDLYVKKKQIEALNSKQLAYTDNKRRANILLNIRREYSLLLIYHEGILKLVPEIFSILPLIDNPITYLKDIGYWYKRRLINQ